MNDLIYFILCSYGITQIITTSSLLDKFRRDDKFWGCPMCVGFWVGLLVYLLNPYTSLFSYEYSLFNTILLSFLSSGTSYILSILFGDFGFRSSSLRRIYGIKDE